MNALIERFFVEISKAKQDTKMIVKFLNNLCIEISGNEIDNA